MSNDEEERALMRIRAAMNIFDAEEVREAVDAESPPQGVRAPEVRIPRVDVRHVISAKSELFEHKLVVAIDELERHGYAIQNIQYAIKEGFYSAVVWGKR